MSECFFFPVFFIPNVKSIHLYVEITQLITATYQVIDKYIHKFDILVSINGFKEMTSTNKPAQCATPINQ